MCKLSGKYKGGVKQTPAPLATGQVILVLDKTFFFQMMNIYLRADPEVKTVKWTDTVGNRMPSILSCFSISYVQAVVKNPF